MRFSCDYFSITLYPSPKKSVLKREKGEEGVGGRKEGGKEGGREDRWTEPGLFQI